MGYSDLCRDYFEGQYSKGGSYWGDQPNLLVPLVSSHLKPHSRVLVVGCGEGRDALFLARLGFDVVATEIAENGLNKIREALKNNGVEIELLKLDAHERHDHLGIFDAVFLMNLLQFLDPDRITDRISHFQSLVGPGGFMSVQVFTTEDPQYQDLLRSGDIGPGTLAVSHPTRKYMIRFFEKRELAGYFSGWEFIYYHEGLMWDKPHGTSEDDFHQHGLAQMLARKKI